MAKQSKAVGYHFLKEEFSLQVPPHYRRTEVTDKSTALVSKTDTSEEYFLPARNYPGDTVFDHIEFALRYEGLNLTYFAALFEILKPNDVAEMVKTKPNGIYSRKLWYLYETMTGNRLEILDLKVGNYTPLVNPDEYFTIPTQKIARQRINLNVPILPDFSPLVRRTEKILAFQNKNLREKARVAVEGSPPEILARAVSYLYSKETKASFLIEREEPDSNRAEQFISLLKQAEKKSFLSKKDFVELQNAIVEPRFKAVDYRDFQNYVGESYGFGQEKVHFICPKPEDVEALMSGLIEVARVLKKADFDPVLMAAIISFGFVFIHPFDDGNGRIHRFLMHNILSMAGFSPESVIFPISATILQQMAKYNKTLESFSTPLLSIIKYSLNSDGEMTVVEDTKKYYSYIDFTFISESFYDFVDHTITEELPKELDFLTKYDSAKRAIRGVADIPDRLIDLFIKICRENKGQLSKAKRKSHFEKLTDEEIARMEEAYAAAMGIE